MNEDKGLYREFIQIKGFIHLKMVLLSLTQCKIAITILFLVYFILVISGVIIFRRKVLVILLSLETANLIIFAALMVALFHLGQPISFAFFLLIMGACEAALGLSLIITMTRSKGSDFVRSTSSNFC